MNGAYLDLEHTATPRIRSIEAGEGLLIVGRCQCGSAIWRTAERFVWSHSTPSRTARLSHG